MATFASTEEQFLLADVDQRSAQWIRPGDDAHLALSMYPGRIFKAKVDSVIWAAGHAQLQATGVNLRPGNVFFVKLDPAGDFSETPLEFGARGLTGVFTSKAIDLVRVIEIQSESLLNYVYNPF